MGLRQRLQRFRNAADRRKFGRLKAGETLSSNVGAVRDLSAGGLKVLSRRKLKGVISVLLWDINRGVRIRAEVMWCKRLAFRRHEAGLQFIDVTPDIAKNLSDLGADNPVLMHEIHAEPGTKAGATSPKPPDAGTASAA